MGVLTDGIDWLIKIRAARMCQLFASCFVWRATQISTNESNEDWHHAPDSCTLEVLRVSPKPEFALFLFGFIQQKLHFVYIFKTKLIWTFMTLGVRGHSVIRTLSSARSLSPHDHAQKRSVTCGKDRMTNCYSLGKTQKYLLICLSRSLDRRLMTGFGRDHGQSGPRRRRGLCHPWPCTKQVMSLRSRQRDKQIRRYFFSFPKTKC